MKTRWARFLWVPLGLILAVFGYFAVRAYLNLVTLHVRDADVRQVVRKMEWQTWKSILVNREIQGRVTLDVKNAPLEEVLDIISKQTQCRWSLFYPLYRAKTSLGSFKKAVRGEIDEAGSGWTNLFLRLEDQPNPMVSKAPPRQPVTLQFTKQELHLAIVALKRFADVKIIAADDVTGNVSLNVQKASMRKAVRNLAKGLRCKWNSCYAMEAPPKPPIDFAEGLGPDGGDFPPPPPQGGPPPPGGPPGGGPPGMPMLPPPIPLTKEQQQQRESDYKALMTILPQEQRARLEMERKMHEQIEATPPEQRLEAMQKMSSTSEKDLSAERARGLLSTTPEQRVDIRRQQNKTRDSQPKK